MPQSARFSPWTNGGLCDVLQPSHGNFPLVCEPIQSVSLSGREPKGSRPTRTRIAAARCKSDHGPSLARLHQSVEPWTNGGLCDVLQPSHGSFPLLNRFQCQICIRRWNFICFHFEPDSHGHGPSFARLPQSVEPWTNGGLCDVNSPPTAIFR